MRLQAVYQCGDARPHWAWNFHQSPVMGFFASMTFSGLESIVVLECNSANNT